VQEPIVLQQQLVQQAGNLEDRIQRLEATKLESSELVGTAASLETRLLGLENGSYDKLFQKSQTLDSRLTALEQIPIGNFGNSQAPNPQADVSLQELEEYRNKIQQYALDLEARMKTLENQLPRNQVATTIPADIEQKIACLQSDLQFKDTTILELRNQLTTASQASVKKECPVPFLSVSNRYIGQIQRENEAKDDYIGKLIKEVTSHSERSEKTSKLKSVSHGYGKQMESQIEAKDNYIRTLKSELEEKSRRCTVLEDLSSQKEGSVAYLQQTQMQNSVLQSELAKKDDSILALQAEVADLKLALAEEKRISKALAEAPVPTPIPSVPAQFIKVNGVEGTEKAVVEETFAQVEGMATMVSVRPAVLEQPLPSTFKASVKAATILTAGSITSVPNVNPGSVSIQQRPVVPMNFSSVQKSPTLPSKPMPSMPTSSAPIVSGGRPLASQSRVQPTAMAATVFSSASRKSPPQPLGSQGSVIRRSR
jgi:hypothetical protein